MERNDLSGTGKIIAGKRKNPVHQMDLSELGGEFAFINRIAVKPRLKSVVVGIGDDAAVVRAGNRLLAITTDMLVERDHFSLEYFTPRQLGIKAMESNVSDIAAMGAKPLYAFISICLPKSATVEFIDGFYAGVYESAGRHGADVLGGDTTHGDTIVVNIALIGEIQNPKIRKTLQIPKNSKKMITSAASNSQIAKMLPLRSNAKEGDLIFVTGHLGASAAGLKLFLKKTEGFDFVKKKHLEPSARMDLSQRIAKIANAMEDVSDGLASEVRNICLASKKGAVIYAQNVPVAKETKAAASACGNDALDYALFGGEDFELVFTVPEKFKSKAQKLGTLVGKVTKGGGVFLEKNGVVAELKRFGYDHFA